MIKNTAKRLVAFILALIAVFVLVSCGKCEHDYKDGICTLCGEEDHDYVKPCNLHTLSAFALLAALFASTVLLTVRVQPVVLFAHTVMLTVRA